MKNNIEDGMSHLRFRCENEDGKKIHLKSAQEGGPGSLSLSRALSLTFTRRESSHLYGYAICVAPTIGTDRQIILLPP